MATHQSGLFKKSLLVKCVTHAFSFYVSPAIPEQLPEHQGGGIIFISRGTKSQAKRKIGLSSLSGLLVYLVSLVSLVYLVCLVYLVWLVSIVTLITDHCSLITDHLATAHWPLVCVWPI
jgi:Flp pilus assembly protein TadB